MVNLELCGGDFVEMVSDSVIGVDFEVGVWGDHVPGIWRKSPCFLVFCTPPYAAKRSLLHESN